MWNPFYVYQNKPNQGGEGRRYGKIVDPDVRGDDKGLGRTAVRIPELDGDKGSGIPDKDLPLSENSRQGTSGHSSQDEMSSFGMPTKNAMASASFTGGDMYSAIQDAAPYSKNSKISEIANVDKKMQRFHTIQKNLAGNFDHNIMEGEKGGPQYFDKDFTQNSHHNVAFYAGGPAPQSAGKFAAGESDEGTTHYFTETASDTPKSKGTGGDGEGASGGGGGQQGGGQQKSSKYQQYSDERLFFGIPKEKRKQGDNKHKKPECNSSIEILKDKIVIKVKDSTITLDEKTITSKAKDKIKADSKKIVEEGNVYLGSERATREVSAKGTITADGAPDQGNQLKKVWGI